MSKEMVKFYIEENHEKISVEELAKITGVTVRTVKKYIENIPPKPVEKEKKYDGITDSQSSTPKVGLKPNFVHKTENGRNVTIMTQQASEVSDELRTPGKTRFSDCVTKAKNES